MKLRINPKGFSIVDANVGTTITNGQTKIFSNEPGEKFWAFGD